MIFSEIYVSVSDLHLETQLRHVASAHELIKFAPLTSSTYFTVEISDSKCKIPQSIPHNLVYFASFLI